MGTQLRRAVTVIEVLFAMVVMLVGLVGMAALLPLAARQASDSYRLTQSLAGMQNAVSESMARESFAPLPERNWWFFDDYGTALNTIGAGPFGYSPEPPQLHPSDVSSTAGYRSVGNMDHFYDYWIRRNLGTTAPTTAAILNAARRAAFAQGICLDPSFVAEQSPAGWPYSATYTNNRGTQGWFRRSRMPFFDETTTYLGGTDFQAVGGATTYPRMLRITIPRIATNHATLGPLTDAPSTIQQASNMLSSQGDLLQTTSQENIILSPLRLLEQNADGFVQAAKSNAPVNWLVTMTPSEDTPPNEKPKYFDMSMVVFSKRDRPYDAAPLAVTNGDQYSKGERLCVATSTSATGLTNPPLATDLPLSSGGSLKLKLWSSPLTSTDIRFGDWIMLSRKMILGTGIGGTPNEIHRHRWYRVIGTDSSETWPKTVTVEGPTWDYPENNPATLSLVPPLINAVTHATIFSNVLMVQRRVIELE
jgi:hypothetical protein